MKNLVEKGLLMGGEWGRESRQIKKKKGGEKISVVFTFFFLLFFV